MGIAAIQSSRRIGAVVAMLGSLRAWGQGGQIFAIVDNEEEVQYLIGNFLASLIIMSSIPGTARSCQILCEEQIRDESILSWAPYPGNHLTRPGNAWGRMRGCLK